MATLVVLVPLTKPKTKMKPTFRRILIEDYSINLSVIIRKIKSFIFTIFKNIKLISFEEPLKL